MGKGTLGAGEAPDRVVGAARSCITRVVVDESPTHDARPVFGQVGTNLVREQVQIECRRTACVQMSQRDGAWFSPVLCSAYVVSEHFFDKVGSRRC